MKRKGKIKVVSLNKLAQIEIEEKNGKRIKLVGLLIKKNQFKTDVFFTIGNLNEEKLNKKQNSYIG